MNLLNDAKNVAPIPPCDYFVPVIFRGAFAHLESADACDPDRIAQKGKRTMLASEILQAVEKR